MNDTATDSLRERIARAMAPSAFETFDRGYTAQNHFATRAFLHAEKTVKTARKKADAALAAIEPLLEAMRRHIRSYEPGTLVGSELNVALHLRDLDGEIWEPWCVPGAPTEEK